MPQAGSTPTRRAVLGGTLGAFGLLLVGCTPKGGENQTASGQPAGHRLLTLQTPAPCASWDPVEAGDVDTQRVIRQMYDTLIGIDPATGAPAPALAESWTVSEDGLEYSFVLRKSLTFHDGTPLDSAAVTTNFHRWMALGQIDDPAVGTVSTLFDAVADPEETTATPKDKGDDAPQSTKDDADGAKEPTEKDPAPAPQTTTPDPLGKPNALVLAPVSSVLPSDALTVRLTLKRPITPLIEALTHPGFSIVNPAALKKADALTGRAPKRGLDREDAGSGPYTASVEADTVVLTAFEHHYLGAAELDEVRLTPKASAVRRAWDLTAGRIDGFDLVTVDTLKQLYQDTQQVLQRDPFSVAYLGMNQANEWLGDERVRRAVAHALDRNALLDGVFISSTKPASSPLPPSLGVAAPPSGYGRDLAKAKRLLDSAGYDGTPIPFLYPTDVARPYLPLPERIFAVLSGQLGELGLAIEPLPMPWDHGYSTAVINGKHAGFHLLGNQGTYRDPEVFLGSLFARRSPQLAYDSPEVRRRIRLARTLPDGEERTAAYADIVELITVDAPLLPLVYPISALAMAPKVSEYPVSPVLDEPLRNVKLSS